MPLRVRTLGHKEVLKLSSEVGVHSVGGVVGLRLRVERNVAGNGLNKRWELCRKVRGKTEKVGLGSYPTVSLLNARNAAGGILDRAIAHGETLKEAAVALTPTAADSPSEREQAERLFQAVAGRLMAEREKANYWRNAAEGARAWGRLRNHLFPVLGGLPVKVIKAEDIVRAFKSDSVQALASASVSKVRALARAIFDRAVVEGLIEDNPMDSSRYRTLMSASGATHPDEVSGHRGALLPEEMPEFFAQLVECIARGEEYGHPNASAKALAFAILTCSRSGNVCKAEWGEFDLEAHTWTIPALKMKVAGNGAHVVYLSEPAEQLAKAAYRAPRQYVFTGMGGNTLRGDGAPLRTLLNRMNRVRIEQGLPEWIDTEQSRDTGQTVRITPHGISRATFKTWTQTATGPGGRLFIPEAVELCLHHELQGAGGLGAAYERQKFIKERKAIYRAWAEYCLSKTSPARWRVAVGG